MIACAVLAVARAAPADEIRKWTDAEGRLHYSVEGTGAAAAADEPPTLQGRTLSADEKFSIQASLRRKEIESQLAAAARDLDGIHERVAANEARAVQAWAPSATEDPAAVTAQRDAFLAVSQLEEDKAEMRRRLRREERAKLKEIVTLWKEFEALDADVTARYGSSPPWWRKRLSCGHCPTLAEADVALHGAKPTPKPEASGAADDEDWDDDEEGWQ
jgi:hypothetical protein